MSTLARRIAHILTHAGLGVTISLVACISEPAEVAPLRVVRTVPAEGGTHPADAPIRIAFDRYLQVGSVSAGLVRLTSGAIFEEEPVVEGDAGPPQEPAIEFRAEVAYDPVDRALVIIPRNDLEVGLGYTVRMKAGVIGLDGAELDDEEFRFSFVAGQPASLAEDPGPVDFDIEVAPVFARKCVCHGPEPGAYPALTPAALVDEPSLRDPGETLVVGGHPLQSYLLLKLLPNYPGRLGSEMPPRDAPMTDDEIRAVLSWIEQLAR